MIHDLSEQEVQRRQTLQQLRAAGIEPFPAALYPVSDLSADLKANYVEGKTVCLAGRMMSQRVMGKASFAELQDAQGRIQVYFNRDELCPGEDKTLYNDVFKKFLVQISRNTSMTWTVRLIFGEKTKKSTKCAQESPS